MVEARVFSVPLRTRFRGITVREGMLRKEPLPRCRECSWNILSHEAAIRDALPAVRPGGS